MKTNIVIQLQVEGTHRWSGCNVTGVDFLRNKHRHVFFIVCKKSVSHDDRDIEIITLKREVMQYFERYKKNNVCDFGEMSCEMISRELLVAFDLVYCSVLEDNENGAEVMV